MAMRGQPLFPGDSEIDQIFKIFRCVSSWPGLHRPSRWFLLRAVANLSVDTCGASRILGTPTEENWPGVKQLPDYKSTFPKFSGTDLARCVPELDPDAIDLLKATLTYDTAKRISGMFLRAFN
jgi:cyclin-dependent kinase